MDQNDRDMLIRIDQKVIAIEKIISDQDYKTLAEKVRSHGKIIWGVIAISVTTAVKAFWKAQ